MQLSHADVIRLFGALETDTRMLLRMTGEDLGTAYQHIVDCAQHNLTLMQRIEADIGQGSLSRTYPNISETKRLLAERK
jgi:hypothetical protein